MKKNFMITIMFLITFALFSAAPNADEIMEKSYNLPSSKDQYNISKMVLIDSKNNKKVRTLEMFTKETDEGTNSFARFLEPSDVKGTTFLTIGHKKGDDEQRIYLPALGKVRRISSSQKDGKFMGSDIYYYDMEDRDISDATYKYLRDDTHDGMECWIIEATPTDENAPYSKSILWVSKENYFLYKTEAYDKKKGKHIKTMVMRNVENINGVLIAKQIVVDNHKDDHKTLFILENPRINIGIKDDVFTVQNMTK